jgi:hypothetical protein
MAAIANISDEVRFNEVFDRGIEKAHSQFDKDVLRISRNCWLVLGIPNSKHPALAKVKAFVISCYSHTVSAVRNLAKCSLPCCEVQEERTRRGTESTDMTRV